MLPIDHFLLVAGLLLLIAIASSAFSTRLGVPVLVIFLAVGMVAGSEGFGGIEFENYGVANGVGTLALVLILFDGGLRTPLSAFRAAAAPALTLATVGVIVTALVTGLAAARVLHVPLLDGLLLGSIVGSTDAAAVFPTLRAKGLRLRERLGATLEIESGVNDPMAVFLTVGLVQVLLGRMELGAGLLGRFVLQMGLGCAIGLAVGQATGWAVNRINLGATGLYPVLAGGAAILAYGLTASLGGSGFLAVYLAGIVLGNRRLAYQRGIYLFHDGLAWLAQITMFVLLGLLSFPSRLADAAPAGLAIALVLMLLARPIAVFACLAPFGYSWRELAFIAWAGLRGAVPIILATFPLLLGFARGTLFFDVVFFVVLVSTAAQGWSLRPLARWLRVQEPAQPEPSVMLEINAVKEIGGDIVQYLVTPESAAVNRTVRDLALPQGAVVAMIARGEELIAPRGSTGVTVGDHVFCVVRPEARALVDRVFSAVADIAVAAPPHGSSAPET